MVEKRPLHDDELAKLFAATRRDTPDPSPELMARIMGDALAETQARQGGAGALSRSGGPWTRLLEAIGGWPTAAGLATAACAGVVIGLASPEVIEDLSGGILSASVVTDVEDMLPAFDSLFEEG